MPGYGNRTKSSGGAAAPKATKQIGIGDPMSLVTRVESRGDAPAYYTVEGDLRVFSNKANAVRKAKQILKDRTPAGQAEKATRQKISKLHDAIEFNKRELSRIRGISDSARKRRNEAQEAIARYESELAALR